MNIVNLESKKKNNKYFLGLPKNIQNALEMQQTNDAKLFAYVQYYCVDYYDICVTKEIWSLCLHINQPGYTRRNILDDSLYREYIQEFLRRSKPIIKTFPLINISKSELDIRNLALKCIQENVYSNFTGLNVLNGVYKTLETCTKIVLKYDRNSMYLKNIKYNLKHINTKLIPYNLYVTLKDNSLCFNLANYNKKQQDEILSIIFNNIYQRIDPYWIKSMFLELTTARNKCMICNEQLHLCHLAFISDAICCNGHTIEAKTNFRTILRTAKQNKDSLKYNMKTEDGERYEKDLNLKLDMMSFNYKKDDTFVQIMIRHEDLVEEMEKFEDVDNNIEQFQTYLLKTDKVVYGDVYYNEYIKDVLYNVVDLLKRHHDTSEILPRIKVKNYMIFSIKSAIRILKL